MRKSLSEFLPFHHLWLGLFTCDGQSSPRWRRWVVPNDCLMVCVLNHSQLVDKQKGLCLTSTTDPSHPRCPEQVPHRASHGAGAWKYPLPREGRLPTGIFPFCSTRFLSGNPLAPAAGFQGYCLKMYIFWVNIYMKVYIFILSI